MSAITPEEQKKLEKLNEMSKNKDNLKKRVAFDFVKEMRIRLSGSNNMRFIDALVKSSKSSGGSLPSKYKIELVSFLTAHSDKYHGITAEDISLQDIIPEVMPQIKSVENKRKLLKKRTESLYEFVPPNDYDTKVKPVIEGTLAGGSPVDEDELIRLIHSPTRLHTFMEQIFPPTTAGGTTTPTVPAYTKDAFKRIATTHGLNATKIKALKPEYRRRAMDLLHHISTGSSSVELDLQELFSIPGLLTDLEKQNLVSIYLPVITLSKAFQLGLITKTQSIQKKKDFIKDNYKLHDIEGTSIPRGGPLDLTSSQIDTIANILNDNDVWLETSSLTLDRTKMKRLMDEYGFQKMSEDIKKPIERLVQIEDEGESIEKFEQFKRKLFQREQSEKHSSIENKTIIGVDKMQTGAVLKVKGKTKDGKSSDMYFKILDDGSRNKGLVILADIGVNSYDKDGNRLVKMRKATDSVGIGQVQTMQFDLLEKLLDGSLGGTLEKARIEVLDKNDIQTQINTGEIKEYSDSLKFKTEIEIEDEREKATGLLQADKDSFEKDKKSQEKKVQDLHKKLEKIKHRLEKKGVDHDHLEEDEEYKKIKEELRNEEAKLSEITGKYEAINEQYEDANLGYNFHHLQSKINEADPEGAKYGLKKGTVFLTKTKKVGDASHQDMWTITECKYDTITIMHQNANSKVTLGLQEFYDGFVANKCTRAKSFPKVQNLLDSFREENKIKAGWDGITIKDGKFVREEKVQKVEEDHHGHGHGEEAHKDHGHGDHGHHKKEEKQEFEFEYLVSVKNDELLKVHYIDEATGIVKVSFGQITDEKERAEKQKKKAKEGDEKKEVWEVENAVVNMSFAYFEKYIRDNQLVPRSVAKEEAERELLLKEQNTNRKNHFWTRFWQNYSFADLADGLHQGWETVEHYLHQGQHEKATLFLGRYIAPWIPHNEIKNHILSDQEGAQKKRMDEMIEKLEKNMDSWWSTTEILHWLLDKDTPQYKLEAGVMFMIKNYGVLYGKKGDKKDPHVADGLQAYRGKFLWYEALGGRKGDALYMQVKNEMESGPQPIPFTEEELVYILLVRQGKGDAKPKRRSRLHKEYKALRNQSKDEEKEKGIKDGKGERQQKKILNKAFDEMGVGNYPNMWGWYEQAMVRGGPLEDQTAIPFVMFFSGIIYKFESHVIKSMKDYPADGKMVPLLRFVSKINDMDMVNRVILKVCKRLHEINPSKYPDIYNEAKAIFDNQKVDGYDMERKKQNACREFYNKYAKDLSDALNMVNGSGSMASKLIYLEKDGYKIDGGGKKGDPDPDFKAYYDTMQTYADGDFKYDKDGTLNDGVAEGGTTGTALYQAVLQTIQVRQGGGFSGVKQVVEAAWKEIEGELRAVPQTVFVGTNPESPENRALQKQALKSKLREIMSALLINHSNDAYVKSLEDPASMTAFLVESGALLSEYRSAGINPEKLRNGELGDAILEKQANSIIRFVSGGGKRKVTQESDSLAGTIEHVKTAAQQSTTQPTPQPIPHP